MIRRKVSYIAFSPRPFSHSLKWEFFAKDYVTQKNFMMNIIVKTNIKS